MTALVIGKVITQRAARCAAHTRADRRTGGAAQAIANQRTTCRTQTAANRRFGFIALLRANCTSGGATHACTDGRAGRPTELLAYHIAQRAADTASQRGSAISGGQGPLGIRMPNARAGNVMFIFVYLKGCLRRSRVKARLAFRLEHTRCHCGFLR